MAIASSRRKELVDKALSRERFAEFFGDARLFTGGFRSLRHSLPLGAQADRLTFDRGMPNGRFIQLTLVRSSGRKSIYSKEVHEKQLKDAGLATALLKP